MLLRSRSYVTNLYIKRDLPIREIARQLNVSHSTVIECLRRLGIHDKGSRKRVITQGQIPFGYNYRNGKLEKNQEEQEVIRIIKQLRSSGVSLRGIARELNKRLVPTKNNGIWQATTVSNILSRNCVWCWDRGFQLEHLFPSYWTDSIGDIIINVRYFFPQVLIFQMTHLGKNFKKPRSIGAFFADLKSYYIWSL